MRTQASGSKSDIPPIAFLRSVRRTRDWPALVIVLLIAAYGCVVLLLPFSSTVRRAAEARFHLADWPLVVWAAFQPVPSMYNFENQWDVTFEGTPVEGSDVCLPGMSGFVNHHIYHRVLVPVSRARFELCGLPATVRFTSTYRGTTLSTTYSVRRGPGEHGLTVVRRE